MNKGSIRKQRYQKLHEMTILKDQRIKALYGHRTSFPGPGAWGEWNNDDALGLIQHLEAA
jgi:hypothetical protein